MWLGLDDTDGPAGSCTTHALLGLLASGAAGDIIGLPRLVRLNPNIPWKTRGNGALVAELGIGAGGQRRLGTWAGRPVTGYSQSRGEPDLSAVALLDLLDRLGLREPASETGLILSEKALPEAGYRAGVTGILEMDQVLADLHARDLDHAFRGSGRGLIGAWAALGWPGDASAYEGILYRDQEARTPDRDIPPATVASLVDLMPDQDYNLGPAGETWCVPHTLCPIALGIRSRSARGWGEVLATGERLGLPGALLFATNHGSNDHFQEPTGPLQVLHSYHLSVTAVGPAAWAEGGHLRLALDYQGTGLAAVVFEPTKDLRHGIAAVQPGETFQLWGALTRRGTIAVEGYLRKGMGSPCFAPYGARRHLTSLD